MSSSEFVLYVEIFSSTITVLSIIVAIIAFVHQKHRELKVSAIKAGMNIEQVVIQWTYIDMVLKESFPKEYEMLCKNSREKMNLFESSEIENVFSSNQITIIRKMFGVNKYNSSTIGAPQIVFRVTRKSVENANKCFPKMILDVVGNTDITRYEQIFHRVLIDTLNKLETICAMIELNVADERTVFTLIGNSFCGFIGTMYYFISSVNESNAAGKKKLQHIIKTFNKWNRKLSKQKNN